MTESYEPNHYPDSPVLQAIRPNFQPSESPQPFITESHSSEEEAEEESTVRRRRGAGRRVRPSQGDGVLISHLDPNRPDIAQLVSEKALDPASPSPTIDTEPTTEAATEDMGEVTLTTEDASQVASKALRVAAVGLDGPPTADLLNNQSLNFANPLSNAGTIQPDMSTPRPPRLLPRPIKTEPEVEEQKEEDSIATSPNLAKYTITPSEPIASTLPALQNSPNRANSMHSPPNTQSLPSLKTALGDQLPDNNLTNGVGCVFPSVSRGSPSMTRATTVYLPPVSGPSPSTFSQPSSASSKDMSTMSPPSTQPSHPSYWRTGPKSETSIGSTLSDVTTPSTSTVSHSSPGSAYPTPGQSQDIRMGMDAEQSNLLNGPMPPNGPFTSSAFKCTYPGCTAQPFQTQYLLNSHANVHSQNRPHYCAVEGCPRGPGGKGFKRKNEMIRHGLVHDSPGYVCPFCPDQQHRYPRPDNLQRSVETHFYRSKLC